jgi:hypothetical protein
MRMAEYGPCARSLAFNEGNGSAAINEPEQRLAKTNARKDNDSDFMIQSFLREVRDLVFRVYAWIYVAPWFFRVPALFEYSSRSGLLNLS